MFKHRLSREQASRNPAQPETQSSGMLRTDSDSFKCLQGKLFSENLRRSTVLEPPNLQEMRFWTLHPFCLWSLSNQSVPVGHLAGSVWNKHWRTLPVTMGTSIKVHSIQNSCTRWKWFLNYRYFENSECWMKRNGLSTLAGIMQAIKPNLLVFFKTCWIDFTVATKWLTAEFQSAPAPAINLC